MCVLQVLNCIDLEYEDHFEGSSADWRFGELSSNLADP